MELDHLQPQDSAWQPEPGPPQWHPLGSLGCTEWPWSTPSLLWQGHRQPGCSVPGSGCTKILLSGTGVSHSSISHLGVVPDCPAARRQALCEHPACRHSLEMGCLGLLLLQDVLLPLAFRRNFRTGASSRPPTSLRHIQPLGHWKSKCKVLLGLMIGRETNGLLILGHVFCVLTCRKGQG